MGSKFDKLKNKLSGEPGVTDPGGLAAAIGRKKYGKANFDSAAAKDKSPKMKKAKEDKEELEKVSASPKMWGGGGGPRVTMSSVGIKKGDEDAIDSVPVDIDNDEDKDNMDKAVRASKKLWGEGTRSVANPKQGGGNAYGGGKRVTFQSAGIKNPPKFKKSDVDLEIDELSKTMEFATMDPITEIKKALLELGPEGLKKSMPNMTEENKELLSNILEDMTKSHTLPLAAPRKLTNVGGDNYVQEDVSGDEADEAMFEAAVKEKDYEQKHQGGAHDMEPKAWEGQIIKSLLELEDSDEVLEGLETIYNAWEIKKAKKMKKGDEERYESDEKYDKDEAAEAYEGRDDAEKKGESGKAEKYERDIEEDMTDADYDKDKSEGKKKFEKGESVDEAVKEIKGPKKVNEVLDDTPESKKDDVLRELRESKMKKAKKMIKNMMYKECADMEEGKAELMKNKMRKALVQVLSEEYTDEEIYKAISDADKKRYEKDEKYDKDEASEAYEGRDDAEKRGDKEAAGKYEKDIEEDMTDADYDKDKSEGKKEFEKGGPGSGKRSPGGGPAMASARLKELDKKSKKSPVKTITDPKKLAEMGYSVKKGWGIEIYPQEDGSWITKAVKMEGMDAKLPEMDQVKMPSELMKDGKAKKPEAALAGDDTADEAIAGLGKMKKSIKWYGEPNDAFKAGRLGRHSYASSVNEYYDAALYKAENPVKEEEMRKSYNKNDINDLIEMNMTTTRTEQENAARLGEFKKSRGSFTRTSFSEEDMIATCHLSKEDIDKL